ncbi:uncharacterized protein LOC124286922 [Haliotis rubra]|uniref:uncharacterized protein LOC124286922 n=1 Tax=Haliotis rubra TaxID=36100 RepID=UPI001EE5D886|nr:uncharacterized protein LOC124286922 [Haliotis rubra]
MLSEFCPKYLARDEAVRLSTTRYFLAFCHKYFLSLHLLQESGSRQDVAVQRVAGNPKDVLRHDTHTLARLQFGKDLLDDYCKKYRMAVAQGLSGCRKDQHPHCLANGSVVLGSCRVKRAVCVENVLEDFGWLSCALQ